MIVSFFLNSLSKPFIRLMAIIRTITPRAIPKYAKRADMNMKG
jgi:hypothetical protein